jgi:hypothetical protein
MYILRKTLAEHIRYPNINSVTNSYITIYICTDTKKQRQGDYNRTFEIQNRHNSSEHKMVY